MAIVRGLIQKSDQLLWDGKTRTGTRLDATGGTITGNVVDYEVDVLEIFGNSISYTRGTISSAVQHIGASNVTLLFAPGTWTIDENLTIPSNFTCRIPGGCTLDIASGKTLTFSGIVHSDKLSFTSGSGTLVLSSNSVDPGDIRRYGATSGSGAIDTAVKNSLSANDFAVIPKGSWRNDAKIDIDDNQTILIKAGATITRESANSSATTPIFQIIGSQASIIGEGMTSTIKTENKCPDGVVLIGADSMSATMTKDILYTTVNRLRLRGSTDYGQTSGDPDACLKIINPQLDGFASYFHFIDQIILNRANYGLWLQGWGGNGSTISNIHAYWIGNATLSSHRAMLYWQGALDVAFNGAFFHLSTDSPMLKIEDFDNTAESGGSDHVSAYNSITGLVCEQSGASALGVLANSNCTAFKNHIQIIDNAAGGNDISTSVRQINDLQIISDNQQSLEFLDVRKVFKHGGTPQTLTGAGAVDITSTITWLVTTSTNALTLVDGAEGQTKFIKMKTDGGDGTLTPDNLGNGTTITFDDVGDCADLLFTDGTWLMMGGTATLA